MSDQHSQPDSEPLAPGEAAALRPVPPPVLEPGHTYATVTDKISSLVLTRRTPTSWFFGFMVSFLLLMVFLYSTAYLLARGIGIWGNNVPVGWAFDIINFVWWIGIGHAGTLISAVLLLFRQAWRTSINRFAEAMTLFAVASAGLYPILHLGRPWLFYWLLPYPSISGVWPQFRSPLIWDVFAVSTYATVSLLFWFVGLIPDLATMRDRSRNRFAQLVFGFLAMGWRGSAVHWHRYQTAYLLLAGLATPLVVSVHSIVGLDFAVSLVPGWHVPLFPPYFVAGAIFSGFAMVMTLAIPLRAVYGLKDFITDRHLDNMAKVMLTTGLIVAYGYMMEAFTAWYSGNQYEWYLTVNRAVGPYAITFWALILCNVAIPQLLWFRGVRKNVALLFVISLVVNVGMWLERFVIIVVSLHRDFLPSSWEMYYPTVWDFAQFFGSIGLFLTLLLLFIRFLPVISIFELRELVHETNEEHHKVKDLSEVYGIAAEFAEPSDLLAAAERAHAAGYRRMDAYTPIPVEGLYEALGRRRTRLPYLTLLGGILGGLCGYALQYWVSVIEYPMNIGGRPLHSWQSFVPIIFETTVLGAALFSVFGMLALNGLPMPYHPLFNLPEFALASRNRFFLCIDKRDPQFDLERTKTFMETLQAHKVTVVPR